MQVFVSVQTLADETKRERASASFSRSCENRSNQHGKWSKVHSNSDSYPDEKTRKMAVVGRESGAYGKIQKKSLHIG